MTTSRLNPGATRLSPIPGAALASPDAGADVWTNVTASQHFSPEGLYGASLAYDPNDNYLVLFGGCSASACPAPAQTWKYAGGSWTTVGVSGSQPPARAFATMVYDSRDGYVLLFGGWAGPGRLLNDTWGFSAGAWTNLTNVSAAPPARDGAAMAYDHSDGYVVLFGGCGAVLCPLNDTWRFQLGAWKNITSPSAAAPSPRQGAAMIWDDNDGYAVLFGGADAAGLRLGDTWQFVHAKWSASVITSPTQPPARVDAAFTYYGINNAAYLFGGNGTNGTLGDLWKFAADAWTNQTGAATPIPSPRIAAAAIESSLYWTSSGDKGRLGFEVVFGGAWAGCLTCPGPAQNDTWVFEPALGSSATVLPSVVEIGESAAFSATGSGGTAPYSFAWQLGDGGTSSSATPSHAFGALGDYTANVTVTDVAGVTSRSTTSVMVLSGPIVTARVEPQYTDVGRTVTFNASATGGTPPYSTRWTFGDGLGFTGSDTTHTYAGVGTYLANVTVSDGVLGLGIVPFAITVNASLVVAGSFPTTTLTAGQNASFNATASLGTPPYAVVWTFGDGAQSFALDAQHAYNASGTYNASLRVSDAVGAVRWTNFTVQVVAAPSSPTAKLLGIPLSWFPWIIGAVIAVVAALVGLVFWRRRRRRSPNVPIAAAAVGDMPWNQNAAEGHSSDSRSSRRARRH